MLLNSWIIEILDMCRIAENVCALIKNNMHSWKTRLFSNNQQLAEVTIKRSLFQGDPCSPLL